MSLIPCPAVVIVPSLDCLLFSIFCPRRAERVFHLANCLISSSVFVVPWLCLRIVFMQRLTCISLLPPFLTKATLFHPLLLYLFVFSPEGHSSVCVPQVPCFFRSLESFKAYSLPSLLSAFHPFPFLPPGWLVSSVVSLPRSPSLLPPGWPALYLALGTLFKAGPIPSQCGLNSPGDSIVGSFPFALPRVAALLAFGPSAPEKHLHSQIMSSRRTSASICQGNAYCSCLVFRHEN